MKSKDFNLELSIQFSENNVQYMKIMENTANNQNYTPDTPEKVAYQAELFGNRIAKQYKPLRKWARKNRVTCYRLYDRDIPEVPLALDLYEFLPNEITDKIEAAKFLSDENNAISLNNASSKSVIDEMSERTWAHLYLYERPYEKPESEEKVWLASMAKKAAEVLGIKKDHVITKTRSVQRTDNSNSQYEKIETDNHVTGTIQEQGQLFKVNLTDYIDTGIFFDHRPLRSIVRSTCSGKSVLNLFCYTGSFTVYAAEGKAHSVESVDMSKTYLDWAKENLVLNGFDDDAKYTLTRQDAVGFINQKNAEVPNEAVDSKKPVFLKNGERLFTNRWDIIILDPPTFSNSKRTDTTLDITRDWVYLVTKCLGLLTEHGTLYFSTNSRRLSFSEDELKKNCKIDFTATDITQQTIPEDYRNAKIHRCWKLVRI